MIKIQPNYHQGIEYIQLSQLPHAQAKKLAAWLPSCNIFTVHLEDIELSECIGYQDYTRWYDHVTFESSFQYYYL